jgi:hypothetical protein
MMVVGRRGFRHRHPPVRALELICAQGEFRLDIERRG